MTHTPLTIELIMLGCAAALVILQIVLQATGAAFVVGLPYLMSNRDEAPTTGGNIYLERVNRALHNILETFPLFVAVTLGVVVAGRTGGLAAIGAQVYVWARTLYLPIYVIGIPYIRTLVWTVSMVGIGMMLWVLLA